MCSEIKPAGGESPASNWEARPGALKVEAGPPARQLVRQWIPEDPREPGAWPVQGGVGRVLFTTLRPGGAAGPSLPFPSAALGWATSTLDGNCGHSFLGTPRPSSCLSFCSTAQVILFKHRIQCCHLVSKTSVAPQCPPTLSLNLKLAIQGLSRSSTNLPSAPTHKLDLSPSLQAFLCLSFLSCETGVMTVSPTADAFSKD